MKKYSCIESFCGAGGMSLGIKRAGFDVLLAFDKDEFAVTTYRTNNSSPCLCCDAAQVTASMLRKESALGTRRLDLWAGGPPCQGFSKQKRGAHNGDSRNELILEYVRLVRELRPRMFILENVVMFAQKRGRRYLESLFNDLHDYQLFPHIYNSADYGLAQTRERFILVGKHKSVKAAFCIPKPTVSRWLTVDEVIGDLPEPPLDYTDHPNYPNHQRARVTPANIKRFSFVPQGGGWQDIPMKHRLKCHQVVDIQSGGWPDVYGRLRGDGQCPTITGGFDSFTRGRYGHPHQDRPLTPREAARLQGFPDDYVFCGTRADIRSQIGNAVPPPLAEAVAREVLRTLMIEDGVVAPPVEHGSQPQAVQMTLAFQ